MHKVKGLTGATAKCVVPPGPNVVVVEMCKIKTMLPLSIPAFVLYYVQRPGEERDGR